MFEYISFTIPILVLTRLATSLITGKSTDLPWLWRLYACIALIVSISNLIEGGLKNYFLAAGWLAFALLSLHIAKDRARTRQRQRELALMEAAWTPVPIERVLQARNKQ